MTRSYIPCHAPQGTVGHAIVQANFEDWLDWRERNGRPVRKHVERAIRDYLDCGDPERGFRVLACPLEHYSRYVARRCRGRGFCAYCLTIRQRELAQHLIDRVIGNVPVRHAVLCFPPQLRTIIGYDEALLTGGFAALAKAVFEFQRRKAEELFGLPRERIHAGSAEVNHRASANMDPNQHFHGIFPDGVFIEVEPGRVAFRRLPPLTQADVAVIAHDACVTFCEALAARGFWETTALSSDGVEGILTLPNRDGRRAKFFGQAARHGEGGVAPIGGAYAFHLLIDNPIELEDRRQLQQLVRYILAPPFKDGQLELNEAGNVVLWLKRERHDGTAYREFTPYEFLDRLADLVPRPNINTVRYYGIYAPRARLRRSAVAWRSAGPRPVEARAVQPMVCPICARKLRVVATVHGRRRTGGTVEPDTPAAVITRGQDRMGRGTSDDGQGRLFS